MSSAKNGFWREIGNENAHKTNHPDEICVDNVSKEKYTKQGQGDIHDR